MPEGADALLPSFFLGGFECSTQRMCDGRRLDLLRATQHDSAAAQDYRQLAEHGILAARDALRWHLIETSPGVYDWSSFLPQLRAARRTGTTVIWDLLHYGVPDGLDVMGPEFVERFASFAAAAALVVRAETDAGPLWCPVNEVSYFAWAGAQVGYFQPCARERGFELKVQLARAAIRATEELLSVDRRARFVQCEPLINVAADPLRPHERLAAEQHTSSQFQAIDMLTGRLWPQLGGREALLDVVGVNYYPRNQWLHGGGPLEPGHPLHRPLPDMLVEVYERYGRPLLISETAAVGERRPGWLAYVCDAVRQALAKGVPVLGVCLYPVLDHPAWDDGSVSRVGLLGAEPRAGRREVHAPLAHQLRTEQLLFAELGFPALTPSA